MELFAVHSWEDFVLLTLFMFAVIMIRYFLVAGAFFLIFHGKDKTRWNQRRLNPGKPSDRKQYLKEIKWSVITSFIFALIGAFSFLGWQNGYFKLYVNVEDYGWSYWILSIPLLMIFHETYYYWIHRLMHHPLMYKKVHSVHHQSLSTSPWTAFSFHPFEGFLEAIILPLMILFIPVHYYVLLIYLTLMTISSVINHLDVEIYPRNFEKHWLGKWLIGASHHSLHHTRFRYNYGLYFTLWDRITGTQSPEFDELFREKTKLAFGKRSFFTGIRFKK